MKKIQIFVGAVLVGLVGGMFPYASAQQSPVLTATLDSNTPAAQTLSAGAQNVDVARITLTATGGDVFMNGMYLATDVSGGLSNFTDIRVLDTVDYSVLGTYSTQNNSSGLIQFTNVTIGSNRTKTYLLRASLAASAAGTVRVGFSGFTFSTQAVPTLAGVPIYGNAVTLPGVTPTPSASVSPSPSASPTPSISVSPTPNPEQAAAELASLKDGDIVKANGNSAVFVIKIVGAKRFKRWMIAPTVLGAYGIPLSRIQMVQQTTLDQFPTSFLMRRFGNAKVYELWDIVEGKTGSRRWIPTVADFLGRKFDFDAVFTINDREYSLYTEGSVLKAPVQ